MATHHPLKENWKDPAGKQLYGNKEIYGNQYNIGQVIVDKFLQIGALKGDFAALSTVKQVNVLFLGPVFVSLKTQTTDDVALLTTNRGATTLNRWIVTNQVKDAEGWLGDLKSNPGWLHILIHDEAHWGIAKKTQNSKTTKKPKQEKEDKKDSADLINKFFHSVANNVGSNTQLLVLAVSATLAVLVEGIEHMSDQYRVRWPALALDPRFALPTYVPISQLIPMFDPNIRKIAKMSAEHASEAVCQEYVEAIEALIEGRAAAESNVIFPCLMTLWNHAEPALGAVRLRQQEDANKLERALSKLLNRPEHQERLKVFNSVDPKNDWGKFVKNWQQSGRTLVILVDKVRMGDRVPSPTLFWDVRSRYNKMIGSFATFVQDVGRCAGHNKHIATILISTPMYDMSKPDRTTVSRLDQLLTKRGDLVKTHPEYEGNGVYTRLKNHLVLLEAAPQVGKTGAILAFLDIIDNAIKKTNEGPLNELTPRNDDFNTLNRILYFEGRQHGFDRFHQHMLSVFDHYHRLLITANQAWGNDTSPARKAAQFMLAQLSMLEKIPKDLVIVDAGCGGCEFALHLDKCLAEDLDLKDCKVKVIGMDLPNSLPKFVLDNLTAMKVVEFEYQGGAHYDTNLEKLPADSVFAVVFCLSFSGTDDVTSSITAARHTLTLRGMMFVADLQHRFDQELKNFDLRPFGFKRLDSSLLLTSVRLLTFTLQSKPDPLDHQLLLNPKYSAEY